MKSFLRGSTYLFTRGKKRKKGRKLKNGYQDKLLRLTMFFEKWCNSKMRMTIKETICKSSDCSYLLLASYLSAAFAIFRLWKSKTAEPIEFKDAHTFPKKLPYFCTNLISNETGYLTTYYLATICFWSNLLFKPRMSVWEIPLNPDFFQKTCIHFYKRLI